MSKTSMGNGDLLRTPMLHDMHILFEGLSSNLQNPPLGPIAQPSHQPIIALSGYADSIVMTTFAAATTSHTFSHVPTHQNGCNDLLASVTAVHLEQAQTSLPTPGIFIHNLGCKHGAWHKAVEQRKEGDTANGMPSFCDWPDAWFKGLMRTVTGSKRHQRKTIADKYKRYVLKNHLHTIIDFE